MKSEWVDAVAEVLYNRQLMPDELPWHLNSDLDREEPREDAAAVLSAVLPLIADAVQELADGVGRTTTDPNAYARMCAYEYAARFVRSTS